MPHIGWGFSHLIRITIKNEAKISFFEDICLTLRQTIRAMREQYPSKLLEKAVNEFSKLPGIGHRTALRLVLHLLKQDADAVRQFGESIITLKEEVKYCKICHNISDTEVCEICADPNRDRSVICVVENIRNVMSIEDTQQFHGLYHVLGGMISPMDGIGPRDLELASLVDRVAEGGIQEVILAMSPTLEGDTTNFYIARRLAPYHTRITVLARGVNVGDELEYTDEITLGRSIINRVNFNSYQTQH